MDKNETVEILKELPERIAAVIMPSDRFFDYKGALDFAIKTLEADGWISVKERLPEDETDVLVCNAKGDMIVCRGSRSTEIEGEFIWYVCDWRYGNVTHWRPLPKAPESEATNDN